MFDNDDRRTAIAKDRRDNAIEDRPHLCPRLAFDIYTFLIEGDMPLHVCDRVGTKAMHNLIATNDRHRQTTTIALESRTQTLVLCRHNKLRLRLSLFGSDLTLSCLRLLRGTTLLCLSGLLCLPGSRLSTGFLLSTPPGSGTSLRLSLRLLGLRLGDTTRVLPRRSLGSRLLPSQFLCTLLPRLSLSLALSLRLGLCLRTGNLFGNEFIYPGIEFCIPLLLLGDNTLDGLLLFLQTGDHLLLFHLLRFERLPLLFTLIEQVVFQALCTLQFLIRLSHLLLHMLHRLTLRLLIRGVFTYEPYTAVHL